MISSIYIYNVCNVKKKKKTLQCNSFWGQAERGGGVMIAFFP